MALTALISTVEAAKPLEKSRESTSEFSSQKLGSALCKGLAILGAEHFHFTILRDPFMFSTQLSRHFIGIPMFSIMAIHQNNG